jgi:acetoin utilization deacetylase AcuC-like enzyme
MMSSLMDSAARHCQGRVVACHEGGYSELYVPFCGLAVLEQLSGVKTLVTDPMCEDVSNFAYQELQPHQAHVIEEAAEVVQLLKSNMGAGRKAAAR